MHLTRMRLGGVPPFTEPVEFVFDERVNVFVGPNASGKSTVLSEMNLALDKNRQQETSMHRYWEGKRPASIWDDNELEQDAGYISEQGLNYVSFAEYPNSLPPTVYLESVRIALSVNAIGERTDLDGTPAKKLLEREFSGENLRKAFDVSQTEADRMFEEERGLVESGIEDVERRAGNFLSVGAVAYTCAKSICNEIITGNRPRNYVTGLNLEYLEHQPMANFERVSIRRSLGMSTIDEPNFANVKPEHRPTHSGNTGTEPLDASFLSLGTQLTLLWIWWLALKMLHHYEFAKDWNEQPAILLIDEIENHLHPTWQRRVIPALLEHFPGLQIFATTHSPFVVAGLRAGQVHMLKRDEKGVVRATTNNEAIEGWTADEILRVYMGVEDPTDDATAAAARELRRLRGEGVRADEGEEEERQAEMQRLRQIVDRVELSGPRVAEDARFLADLRSILERHSQSQNLNQENG